MKWYDAVMLLVITAFAWLCFMLAFTLPERDAILDEVKNNSSIEEVEKK